MRHKHKPIVETLNVLDRDIFGVLVKRKTDFLGETSGIKSQLDLVDSSLDELQGLFGVLYLLSVVSQLQEEIQVAFQLALFRKLTQGREQCSDLFFASLLRYRSGVIQSAAIFDNPLK